ncbi:MAG: hypothetical protein NT069_08050 [Planctomycetota bacterium]|nr:hypothetical protein [Planctomycetota bacterium]
MRFRRRTQLESRKSQLKQKRSEWQEQREQTDEAIRQLVGGDSVPSEAALAAARQRRDDGWRLIQARLSSNGVPPDPAREQEYAGDLGLEGAFTRDIATADDIADRLRTEADRVAQLAKLNLEQERSQRRLARLEEDEQDLAGELDDWNSRWRSTWEPVGIKMRGWITRHSQLVTLAGDLQKRQGAAQVLETRLRQQSETIRAEFAKLGIVESGELSHPLLTQFAEDEVARLAKQRQTRAAAESEADRQSAELEGLRQDREKLRSDLEKWRTAWSEITRPAAAEPDARPEEVQSMLATIDEVCEGLVSIADKDARIHEMQTHIDEFRATVAGFAAVVAPEIAGSRPDEAAAELQRRLAAAQRVDGQRKAIESQLADERQARDKAQQRIALTEGELDALLRRADCPDLATLVELERKSVLARDLRERLKEVDEVLSGFAAGADLSSFLTEVSLVDADRVPVQIDEIAQALADLDRRRSECQEGVGRLQSELDRRNGGVEAVVAAQEAQETLATIREQAEEYVRLKIAGGILRRYLERYRQETQDPVLKRASELFARLSINSFSGIKSDFNDKDEPILLGVRPSGAVVEVEGMSDGTRDQLFLAFRLANLERQMETQARLPLVVDDILINFDDARSKATLGVLADLARQTQVLFFTHHERLVELAESVVPEGELAVHRLSRS